MRPLGMQTSDIRSSAWFGAKCRLVYFIINLNRSGAEPGVMSEAQRRAFGGNGFFLFVPAERLIDDFRICLELDFLHLPFYYFFHLLSINLLLLIRIFHIIA
jgi:hypothetical protein